MLKFIVVVHRKPGWTAEKFRDYFVRVHGPLAQKLSGLRQYIRCRQARCPPIIGQTLAHYQIVEKIRAGRRRIAYRACDEQLDQCTSP